MQPTRTLSKSLDTERRLLLGRKARLFLLDHDADAGYKDDTALEVLRGWFASDDSQGEGASIGQLKLEVAESSTVTSDKLASMAAVVLWFPEWTTPRVCKIVSRIEPIGNSIRIWAFSITPTSEEFALP